nr:PIG-L deacetylase family protein [uncultured Marinobacter sp.]
MLSALLEQTERPLNVLCLGAHSDDIEIGCGGTLLWLLASGRTINLTWVVFASNDVRRQEAETGAALFTGNAAQVDLRIHDFRDGFLPTEAIRLKETFETLKTEIDNPDLIFTHYREDLHQDHRKVAELTWNTFRNHLILEYEIPKWDGDFGSPNGFVPLTRDLGLMKIRYLQQAYNSQQTKRWFTDDLFWSVMRIRGMECNARETIAEAFYCRKLVVGL